MNNFNLVSDSDISDALKHLEEIIPELEKRKECECAAEHKKLQCMLQELKSRRLQD